MKRTRWSVSGLILAMAMAGGCAHPPAPPPEDEPLKLAREAAEAAFSRGDYEAAAGLFAEALNRASIRDDGRAASRCRYQMAACRIAQGRMGDASDLLESARDEALLAGDEGAAARAETAWARVKLETGAVDEAVQLAGKALLRPAAGRSGRLIADLHLVLAEAALRGGDKVQASAALLEAEKQAGRKPVDPVLAAVCGGIRGRILLLEEASAKAAPVFDEESAAWQRARRFGESATALERAGQAYRKAGQDAIAADRMYRAARIRSGLKQGGKAIESAGLAAAWAKAAGQTALRVRSEALVKELSGPAKP